jgi:hypothetical protein
MIVIFSRKAKLRDLLGIFIQLLELGRKEFLRKIRTCDTMGERMGRIGQMETDFFC